MSLYDSTWAPIYSCLCFYMILWITHCINPYDSEYVSISSSMWLHMTPIWSQMTLPKLLDCDRSDYMIRWLSIWLVLGIWLHKNLGIVPSMTHIYIYMNLWVVSYVTLVDYLTLRLSTWPPLCLYESALLSMYDFLLDSLWLHVCVYMTL